MMTKQKNKILTFFFALIPGAGQMYLGFMKRGLSLVLYVVFTACVAMALGMEELLILIPPVWMYAFFDAINLNGCDAEQFALIEDDYVTFGFDPGLKNFNLTDNTKKMWGKGLIFVGVFFLASNVLSIIGQFAYMFDYHKLGWLINDTLNYAPRIIIAIVLILMGKSLISSNMKKHEYDEINFKFFVEDHSHKDVKKEDADIEDAVIIDQTEETAHTLCDEVWENEENADVTSDCAEEKENE